MEAREKAGKPCDMCNNYEAQLQNIQDDYKREQVKAKSLERRLNHELQTLENKQKYITDLENSLNNSATEAQNQVSVEGGEKVSNDLLKSLYNSVVSPHLECTQTMKYMIDTVTWKLFWFGEMDENKIKGRGGEYFPVNSFLANFYM